MLLILRFCMRTASCLVKRTDNTRKVSGRQMDIKNRGIQGFMSHKSFYGKQIRTVFIKMCAKSMAERMAGQSFGPSEPPLVFMNVTGQIKGINGSGRIKLFREKPSFWAAVLKPVFRKKIKGSRGKDGITVCSGFRMADMDPHFFAPDILITQMADLTDAQAGRIHKSKHGTLFQIRKCGNKLADFRLGRDVGKIRIKLTHRKLSRIPGFMQDIDGEKAQL